MSAIGAIINFNQKPVDPDLLADLWRQMAHNHPDGGDIELDGPVGICYRAFHTTRQSRSEQQPFVAQNGFIVAFDGRLDNRGELIVLLHEQLPYERENLSDVEIVAAAFARWDEDCVSRLIGEFALVVWNPLRRTLLLARDHIGARTLYYHLNKDRLICSSELEALIQVAGAELNVNEEYVAGFLAYDPEPELTPFNGFYAVKPFHQISISQTGTTRERRYWSLADVKPLRYSSDAEYEEHFSQLFRDAVRGPLRSDLPVFADLSGGLDSSAIVCVADQLLAAGEVATPRVETVSQVFDSSPTSDERRFIRYVEEQRGQQSHYVREEDYPLFASLSVENASIGFNTLIYCAGQHFAVRNSMRSANARVLLSGAGGDEITCSNPDPSPELADLLIAGKLSQLHAGLKAWSLRQRRPYVELLWRNALLPVMPKWLRLRTNTLTPVHTFFDHRFAKRMHLHERIYGVSEPFGCSSFSSRDQALGFWTAVRGIATGHRKDITEADISYPFLYRPLVEFMQAIPHTQRVRIGETRSLMRRSLRDVLPEKIRKRQSKGNPSEIISRAIAREWPRLLALLSEARVCEHGYIDRSALESVATRVGLGRGIPLPVLLRALVLEVWLRALEERGVFTKQGAVVRDLHPSRRATVQLRAKSAGAP